VRCAVTDGTVVHEVAKGPAAGGRRRTVRIAHPYGVMNAIVTLTGEDISSVAVERTARAIMDGRIHVPADLLPVGD
jgi:2-methylaconitate cis-trans-isomerase PrpF